jgi:hypothetical protein
VQLEVTTESASRAPSHVTARLPCWRSTSVKTHLLVSYRMFSKTKTSGDQTETDSETWQSGNRAMRTQVYQYINRGLKRQNHSKKSVVIFTNASNVHSYSRYVCSKPMRRLGKGICTMISPGFLSNFTHMKGTYVSGYACSLSKSYRFWPAAPVGC